MCIPEGPSSISRQLLVIKAMPELESMLLIQTFQLLDYLFTDKAPKAVGNKDKGTSVLEYITL